MKTINITENPMYIIEPTDTVFIDPNRLSYYMGDPEAGDIQQCELTSIWVNKSVNLLCVPSSVLIMETKTPYLLLPRNMKALSPTHETVIPYDLMEGNERTKSFLLDLSRLKFESKTVDARAVLDKASQEREHVDTEILEAF